MAMHAELVVFFLWMVVAVFHRQVDAGCSGVRNLPLKMGLPNYKVNTGNRDYTDTVVATLGRKLKTDIPGLSYQYALEVAENSIEADEDFEHTFTFCMEQQKATLTQYEIMSKKKGGKISITWKIAKVSLTYEAKRDITVHARRRRRWIGGGRRRCARVVHNRGVTKAEISKIRNKLHSVATKSVSWRLRRMSKKMGHKSKSSYLGNERACPVTSTRPKRPIMRKCSYPRRAFDRMTKAGGPMCVEPY